MEFNIRNCICESQTKELESMYEVAKDLGYVEDITGNVTQGDEVAFVEAVFIGTYPRSSFSHFEMLYGKIVKDSYGEKKTTTHI